MSKRELTLYLEDIKTAIDKIEEYTRDLSFEDFVKSGMTIDAVVRNLSIIGEAVSNISDEVKTKYPDIPWKEAIGMRNKVIHEYFGIDEGILWKTLREDLPKFRKQVVGLEEEVG